MSEAKKKPQVLYGGIAWYLLKTQQKGNKEATQ